MNFRPLIGVQVEQNRCKDRALRKAVTLGSPRTGVIAHVHPDTSISSSRPTSRVNQYGMLLLKFVKKTSVPDSVICCC